MRERTLDTRRPYEGRLISLRVDDVALESGRQTSREVVEHPGAVAMLAWDGARIGLVRQWRHAAGAELLEIPAGTMEAGEQPLATAKRELAEELGIAARDWIAGPAFFTAPGFCTEHLSLFLATDLAPADADAEPDEEGLSVSWLAMNEALDAIDDGRIRDAKSIAGILWLARRIGLG